MRGQLRADGVDTCEGLTDVDGDEYANADAVLVEGSRTYVRVSEHVYVREGSGDWSAVDDARTPFLRSIEGGRVAYVTNRGTSQTLHILGADGIEERRVEDSWFLEGHSAIGLWEIGYEREGDGSCPTLSWSSALCAEPAIWSQIVVVHVGSSRTEVAHLDFGDESVEFESFPLADGSLRLEVNGSAYVIAP